MRPPIIPSGTAVIATSATIDSFIPDFALNRLSPNQIATAIPVMMQSA
jgi:hypothetical protein